MAIKTNIAEPDKNKPLPFVTLVLLEAGVIGILLFLKELNGVDYRTGLVLSAAALLCCAVWYSYGHHRKLFLWLLFTAALGCILAALLLWNVLRMQIGYIISSLLGEPGPGTMQVTETALLLAVVMTVLLFVLECLIKNHAIFYELTTAMLLTAPLLGVHTNVETVFLLVLFQLAFWGIQIAGRRRKKKQILVSDGSWLSGKIGTALGVMVVIALCIALPLVIFVSETLYDSVHAVEGFVFRSLNTISGRAGALVTDGQISRGSNYPTGAEHLELLTTLQPTETLYLCGFSGGEYMGGAWTRANDEALLENVAERLGREKWKDIDYTYHQMYYVLNQDTYIYRYLEQEEVPADSYTLGIRHINGDYENLYMPYYSWRQFSLNDMITYRYYYDYYERKDMYIDMESLYEGRSSFMVLEEAYLEEAKKAYTQVPTELLPRLTALVEANPLTDLEDITAFILYTLHSNATYTLTPGWSAFNEDVVEYFLFERGTGFCEHYAATAALMYRLYGIPARYVSGYAVSPADFEGKDGVYRAVATDESAHAWVEIFLEDYGWTPVEVTPAADGSSAASYPGFDSTLLDQIWSERGWDVTVPSLGEEAANVQSSSIRSGDTDFLLKAGIAWKECRKLLCLLISCFGCFVLLLPLFLHCRRLRILRKAESSGCRAMFAQLVEMLHFGGVLREYDGEEEEFAVRLAEAGVGISMLQAGQLISVVSKAAFGAVPPDESEEAFVRKLCYGAAGQIYAGLPWHKKLIFKYIMVFV